MLSSCWRWGTSSSLHRPELLLRQHCLYKYIRYLCSWNSSKVWNNQDWDHLTWPLPHAKKMFNSTAWHEVIQLDFMSQVSRNDVAAWSHCGVYLKKLNLSKGLSWHDIYGAKGDWDACKKSRHFSGSRGCFDVWHYPSHPHFQVYKVLEVSQCRTVI